VPDSHTIQFGLGARASSGPLGLHERCRWLTDLDHAM